MANSGTETVICLLPVLHFQPKWNGQNQQLTKTMIVTLITRQIFKNTAFYLIIIFLHMVWIQKYTYSHHIETRAQQSKSFDSFWHDGNTYTPVFSPQQEFTSHIKLRFLSVSSFKCFMQCSAIFSNCAGRLIKKQKQF